MVIRFAGLTPTPWRNGMGRRADIATGPGWTLGFAWLEADAPFSDFAGQDRTITLVEGAGFILEFPGAVPGAFPGRPALRLDQPFTPTGFDGGLPCDSRLLGGPCLVLNAISARAWGRHSVTVTDHCPEAGFAVILRGGASLADGGAAGPCDTLVLPGLARLAPGTLLAAVRFCPGD